MFVSSGSVYADAATIDQDETAPLLVPLEADTMASSEDYGSAKAACERLWTDAVGGSRIAIVRAGLIGGPGDPFDRVGYYVRRFAKPSNAARQVLVPAQPELSTQAIDVRDLAAWIVSLARTRTAGAFNACGKAISLSQHIEIARTVAATDATPRAATPDWLEAHGVQHWMGPRSLPLWLPWPAYAGFSTRSVDAAIAAGLRRRPLEDTLIDTLEWERWRTAPAKRQAGLTDDEERELLRALDEQ